MQFLKMVQKNDFDQKAAILMSLENNNQKFKTFPKPSWYVWDTYPSSHYQLHPIMLLHSHAMLAQCYFRSDYHGGIDSHAK